MLINGTEYVTLSDEEPEVVEVPAAGRSSAPVRRQPRRRATKRRADATETPARRSRTQPAAEPPAAVAAAPAAPFFATTLRGDCVFHLPSPYARAFTANLRRATGPNIRLEFAPLAPPPPDLRAAGETADRSLVARFWRRSTAHSPTVLLFDQQALGRECGELPLLRWLADPRARLLLVRSGVAAWSRRLRPLVHLLLDARPLGDASELLCFAKPAAGEWAARWTRAAVRSPAAVGVALDALVREHAGTSALLLVRDADRAALRRFESPDFVVL